MKKIEITEENYETYKTFLEVKKRENTDKSIRCVFYTGFAVCSGILLFSMIGALITNQYIMETLLIVIIETVVLIIPAIILIEKMYSSPIRSFKKLYPNFDMNIDINELEKELVKYEELSKIPKDIETKKEGHLSINNDNFKEMSTGEKLAFLEREKEFWEQVQIQEKYSNSNENKEMVPKMRKIEF